MRPETLPAADRVLLLRLQREALGYFIDNQLPSGLVLDRQSNHGPRRPHGLCSVAATGMGFIAVALASAPPYGLIGRREAVKRVRTGLKTVFERLPHDHGVVPHFIDSASGVVYGLDHFSTVETAWLTTGALWAAALLEDAELKSLAARLYDRVDWHYWTGPELPGGQGLLRHGKDRDGRFLNCSWDRLNGETIFMYVLAIGAADGRAVDPSAWEALRPFYGSVAGLRFNNADLGLFVFQYGMDLLNLGGWRAPGEVDLSAEARLATLANYHACRAAGSAYRTFQRYWGLSAGDGPDDPPRPDRYRCYAPGGPVDGTAHLTATLAAVASGAPMVLENLQQAEHDRQLPSHGRYGFSNVNLDRGWVGRDMIGIDAGAAVLALDNYLMGGRVRRVFHGLSCVQRGLQRLRFTPADRTSATPETPAEPPTVRRAS
jgi:hypothetical protein